MTTYASRYLHSALNSDSINSPDLTRVGEYRDVVEAIYDSHRSGRAKAARDAWNTIVRLRPELATFPQPRNLIPANDLKLLTAPEYMLADYPFYANSFNVLVGASGGGKSFVALDFCGKLIKFDAKHQIVYVAGEGLNGYADRWECLKDHLSIADDANRFHFYQKPVQVMDTDSRQQFIDEVEEERIRPTIIVVDTLARSAVGMEENSNKEMGQFVAGLDALRAIWGCGVLVVHHTGKDGHVRGASALIAACDSALMLSKSDGLIKLSNDFDSGGKNKHGVEHDPQFVELSPYTVNDFSSAVIRPASQVLRSPKMSGNLTPNQRTILELLDSADTDLRVKQIQDAVSLSQATVYRVLKQLRDSSYVTLDELSEVYRITSAGKEVWYSS